MIDKKGVLWIITAWVVPSLLSIAKPIQPLCINSPMNVLSGEGYSNNLIETQTLAPQVAMIPPHGGRKYDVGIFQFLVNHYHKYHRDTTGVPRRVYLIGGDDDLLFSFRNVGLDAWRITIDPHTPFDLVAYPNAIPLARESGLAVLFLLEIKDTPWQSMKLFVEATQPLHQGGVIVFFNVMAPHFEHLAKHWGFYRLPFQWYDMSIWKKTGRRSA
jgi:hypothetical protein